MKENVKLFFEIFGYILSFICPLKMQTLFSAVCSHVYTGFLRKRFGSLDSSALITFRAQNLRGLNTVYIGARTKINRGVQLTTWKSKDGIQGVIRIGQDCNIRANAHITAVKGIEIGNNLLTGTNVLITDNSHGRSDIADMYIAPEERTVVSKGPVVIGNNVWLGNNVCIMPNVKIGDGVIIGANSVVTKDIPDYCVAAGVPARVIKMNKK